MDKDRVKGTVDDAVGRAKRQVGEWTGDTEQQAEGTAQQVKGKAEKAWGTVKDAVKDATKKGAADAGAAQAGMKRDAGRAHEEDIYSDANPEPEHAGTSQQKDR